MHMYYITNFAIVKYFLQKKSMIKIERRKRMNILYLFLIVLSIIWLFMTVLLIHRILNQINMIFGQLDHDADELLKLWKRLGSVAQLLAQVCQQLESQEQSDD